MALVPNLVLALTLLPISESLRSSVNSHGNAATRGPPSFTAEMFAPEDPDGLEAARSAILRHSPSKDPSSRYSSSKDPPMKAVDSLLQKVASEGIDLNTTFPDLGRLLNSRNQPTRVRVAKAKRRNETAQQNYTCTEGPAWIVVLDEGRTLLPHFYRNVPICLQVLRPSDDAMFETFWQAKMQAIQDYLVAFPKVSFVVVSDDDVWVNPVPWETVMADFNDIVGSGPRLVAGTEQSCWAGDYCRPQVANGFLARMRHFYPNLTTFMQSQYMGERGVVLRMIGEMPKYMDKYGSYDDQMAIFVYAQYPPYDVRMDVEEKLFMSMARGMWPEEGARYTCNYGDYITTDCFPNALWGTCKEKDGWVAVYDQKGMKMPLIVHFNGPTRLAMVFGKHCYGEFNKVLGSRFMHSMDHWLADLKDSYDGIPQE